LLLTMKLWAGALVPCDGSAANENSSAGTTSQLRFFMGSPFWAVSVGCRT